MARPTIEGLFDAVLEGDLAAATTLLPKLEVDAPSLRSRNDESLLMAAIRTGVAMPLVRLLVETGGASLTYRTPDGHTPLSHAVMADRRDVIDYFATRGAKVSFVPFAKLPQREKDEHLAAMIDHERDGLAAQVERMLAAGADPNGAMVDGKPALLYLVGRSFRVEAVYTSLLAAGADATALDSDGLSALHHVAADATDTKIAKLLIAAVGVDVRDRLGRTALHHAVTSGYWDAPSFVRFLLAQGADPQARDASGRRPIDVAIGTNKEPLREASVVPLSKATKALLTAIAKDDPAAVKRALAAGGDLSAVDGSEATWGDSALGGIAAVHAICGRGVGAAVAELVLAHPGLDPNVRSTDGRSALHYLLQYGQGPDRRLRMERLLALGADPDAVNDRGATPLYELISAYEFSDELELFHTLVAAGADPARRNFVDRTVLDELLESTRSFHEQGDKPGFVRMVAALLADKLPGKSTKPLAAWLATKGAKYAAKPAKPSKPARPAKPSKAELAFTKITGGKLGKLVEATAYLPIGGAKRAVALFDWFAWLREEADDQHAFVAQVRSHHITGRARAEVNAGRWIPFGVVGMTGALDSYEEIAVDGTLFLDLGKAKSSDAPVVFVPQAHAGLKAKKLEVGDLHYTALIKQLKRK